MTTDLEKSAFLMFEQVDRQEIELILDKVSAILLVPISDHSISPVGIIHPAPKYKFDIWSLTMVPLLQLKHWPLKNNLFETQWTLPPEYDWPLKIVRPRNK